MSSNYLFIGEDLSLGEEDIDANEKAALNAAAGPSVSAVLLQNFIDGCVEDGLLIKVE